MASAAQAAVDAPAGDATARAAQAAPSNVNVSIRIFSPGNDGPVTQTNAAGPAAVSVSTTGPAKDGAAPGSGVSSASTPPTPAAPTTWVWNWTWESTAAGCASGAAPAAPSSNVAGSTWSWTWVWRCAPKLGQLPGLATSIIPLAPDLPPEFVVGPGATAFDDAATGPSTGHRVGPMRGRPAIRRTLATHEASAAGHKMWTALGAPSTGRGRGGADSGADQAPAVARVTHSTLGDLLHSPLAASVAAAAAAGAGGSGPGGIGLGAAALFAVFVLFAPHLLIPLKAATARRLPHVSDRRDRPG